MKEEGQIYEVMSQVFNFLPQDLFLNVQSLVIIDHFTYYCLGSQGGKLWVAMRLLGPIGCRKVCRNTAEITENDQSVVLNRRLPGSTFSPNHWS